MAVSVCNLSQSQPQGIEVELFLLIFYEVEVWVQSGCHGVVVGETILLHNLHFPIEVQGFEEFLKLSFLCGAAAVESIPVKITIEGVEKGEQQLKQTLTITHNGKPQNITIKFDVIVK